jgi:hypothetical protein
MTNNYSRRPSRIAFDSVEVGDHVSIVVRTTNEMISGEIKSISDAGIGVDYEKFLWPNSYTFNFVIIPWKNQKSRRLISKGVGSKL